MYLLKVPYRKGRGGSGSGPALPAPTHTHSQAQRRTRQGHTDVWKFLILSCMSAEGNNRGVKNIM